MFSNKLFLNHPVNDCQEIEEKDVFLIAEAAFLSSTEGHVGTVTLLSTDSDAKISTAFFISIQRCRLVYYHVVMMVHYRVLS